MPIRNRGTSCPPNRLLQKIDIESGLPRMQVGKDVVVAFGAGADAKRVAMYQDPEGVGHEAGPLSVRAVGRVACRRCPSGDGRKVHAASQSST